MKFRFAFLFALFLVLIAGIGFSATINITNDINSAYAFASSNTYVVKNNIDVGVEGFFILPLEKSAVTFQCDPGVTISAVGDSASYLFRIDGSRFTLKDCILDYRAGSVTDAVKIETTGTVNISGVEFSGFENVINVIKIGGLTISNIVLGDTIDTFLLSNSGTINGDIVISNIVGGSENFINVNGPATFSSGADISVINVYGGDVTIGNKVANNNKLIINDSTLENMTISKMSDITLSGSTAANVVFGFMSSNTINISNTDVTYYGLVSLNNTDFKLNSSSVSGGAEGYLIYATASVVDYNIINTSFVNADYGLYVKSEGGSEMTLLASGNIFSDVGTAYSLKPTKINALLISGGTMSGVDVAVDAKNLAGDTSIISLDSGDYPDMYFENIDGKIDLSGTFLSNNYPRFLACGNMPADKAIKAGNFYLTIDDYGSFFDYFADSSCFAHFLTDSGFPTEVNGLPFWMFNKDFDGFYPQASTIIDEDVATDEFGVIMSYKAPIFVSKKTVGGIYIVGPYNGVGLASNDITYIKLRGKVDALIANNNLSIDSLSCDLLETNSDLNFNYDPDKFPELTNIVGKTGLGGNYWYGFSDEISECVNEDDDAFCDSKYNISCNDEPYKDNYPLTLFTSESNDEPDQDSDPSGGSEDSTPSACTKNSDCLNSESCLNGKCTLLKCTATQVIVDHKCVDCVNDFTCAANAKCVSGKCETFTCKSDEKVENHKCVLKTGSGTLGGDNKSSVDVDTDVNKGVDTDVNDNVSTSKSKDILAWIDDHKMILGIIGGVVVLLIIALIVVIYFAKHKKGSVGEEPEEPIDSTPKEEPVEEPKEEPQEDSDEFSEESWSK